MRNVYLFLSHSLASSFTTDTSSSRDTMFSFSVPMLRTSFLFSLSSWNTLKLIKISTGVDGSKKEMGREAKSSNSPWKEILLSRIPLWLSSSPSVYSFPHLLSLLAFVSQSSCLHYLFTPQSFSSSLFHHRRVYVWETEKKQDKNLISTPEKKKKVRIPNRSVSLFALRLSIPSSHFIQCHTISKATEDDSGKRVNSLHHVQSGYREWRWEGIPAAGKDYIDVGWRSKRKREREDSTEENK